MRIFDFYQRDRSWDCPTRFDFGGKLENNMTQFCFHFTQKYSEDSYKYIVLFKPRSFDPIVVPLVNDRFTVGSSVTQFVGEYRFVIVVSSVPVTSADVDNLPSSCYISKEYRARVEENKVSPDTIDHIHDPNWDLIGGALKEELVRVCTELGKKADGLTITEDGSLALTSMGTVLGMPFQLTINGEPVVLGFVSQEDPGQPDIPPVVPDRPPDAAKGVMSGPTELTIDNPMGLYTVNMSVPTGQQVMAYTWFVDNVFKGTTSGNAKNLRFASSGVSEVHVEVTMWVLNDDGSHTPYIVESFMTVTIPENPAVDPTDDPIQIVDIASLMDAAYRTNSGKQHALDLLTADVLKTLRFRKGTSGDTFDTLEAYTEADVPNLKVLLCSLVREAGASYTALSWYHIQHFFLHNVYLTDTASLAALYDQYWWKENEQSPAPNVGSDPVPLNAYSDVITAAQSYRNGNLHAWDNLTPEKLVSFRFVASENGNTFETLPKFKNSQGLSMFRVLTEYLVSTYRGDPTTLTWYQLQAYYTTNTVSDDSSINKDRYWWWLRDTAPVKVTDVNPLPILPNAGKYVADFSERYNAINIYPTAPLEVYESSNAAQGSGQWVGVLISLNWELTSLSYKTTQADFTPLTQADIAEAKSAGAIDNNTLVWWVKAEEMTEFRNIYLKVTGETDQHALTLRLNPIKLLP